MTALSTRTQRYIKPISSTISASHPVLQLCIYIYSFEAWYNDTFVELLTFIASRSIFYIYILFIYRETKCIPNVCHRYHYFLLLLLSLLSSHFSSFISLHSLSRSISCFSLQRIFFTVFVGRNRYTRNQSGLCR